MNARSKVIAGVVAVAVAAALAGCGGNTSNAQTDGQKLTEQAYKQQSDAVPYPVEQLHDSLERRNIRERLLRTNKPNAISYVYVLGMTGGYVGYYVIKGKVSSTQSQMTAEELMTWTCNDGHGCNSGTVTAPGDDGSYGQNEDGIFFFLTDGTMVETSMPYIVSDQPLPVNAPKLNPVKAGP